MISRDDERLTRRIRRVSNAGTGIFLLWVEVYNFQLVTRDKACILNKMALTEMGKSTKGGRPKSNGRHGNKRSQFVLSSEPLPRWREAKANLEKWMLIEALERTDGNMAAASRMLGITKVAVLHAVRRHDLEAHTRPRED